MFGAGCAGGRVIQPAVSDDPLYRWILGNGEGDPPRLGSLPNHFVVEVDGDPIEVARAAKESFDSAWHKVCEAVWNLYVGPATSAGQATADIWDRQVSGFWEFVWTADDADQADDLLERRKHWRDSRPAEEAGDKCTLMHDLQELSGYIRARGRNERERQDDFWRLVRRVGRLSTLDLRDNERLSAIWLVKRLFPLVSAETVGWKLEQAHWPSTIELAATSVSDIPEEVVTDPPPLFYALLLADGDRLGRLVDTLGGEAVGAALSNFTAQAPDIVSEHDGVTVYAGGDDVLAMLPVSGALDCAAALADAYTSAFPEEARSRATLSAAVAFAQIRLPLAEVIREAHRLLDEVAKDGNGRNSLAAGVLKPGGLNCQWTTTWKRRGAAGDSACAAALLRRLSESLQARAGDPGLSSSLVYRIRDLLARLCERRHGEADRGARAGSTVSGPGGPHRWRPGDWGAVPAGIDLRTFLRAEIGHSLTVNQDDGAEAHADDLTDRVRGMLAPSRGTVSGDDRPRVEVGVDALLLARFLACGGYEEAGG